MITVLFSGGIDSWACLNWAVEKFGKENVEPIYFNFGQRCYEQEVSAALTLCEKLDLALEVVPLPYLCEDEVTGHVPLRNLTFILFAAMRVGCEGIVFGMLKGEASEDKNPTFVKRVQTLLDSQFARTLYRSEVRKFKIYTPFDYMTKTQVVAWLRKTEVRASGIYDTVGCYEGKDKLGCGECMSCINRWVAFTLNDLDIDNRPFHVMLDTIMGKRKLPIQRKMSLLMVLWVIVTLPSRLGKYWDICRAMLRHSKESLLNLIIMVSNL